MDETAQPLEQQSEAALVDEKPSPSGFPLCPRCSSEMSWGGYRTKISNLGCIMGLVITFTKGAWLNLLLRPKCLNCGKISKFEVISHQGKVPGIFWFWGISAVIGGGLVVAAIVVFLIGTGKPR